MKLIGLTGGIASGKSTVAVMLKELGAAILDADQTARDVIAPGQPAWQTLRDNFSQDLFLPNGELDRKAMGQLAFTKPEILTTLNKIIHPAVIKSFEQKIAEYRLQGKAAVVLDVPLLLEAGMESMVDEVWVVAVDEQVQIERMHKRDGLCPQEAQKRIDAQMPLSDKLQKANRIIWTNVDMELLRKIVEKLWMEVSGEKQ